MKGREQDSCLQRLTGIRRHRLRALFAGSKDWEHSGADYLNHLRFVKTAALWEKRRPHRLESEDARVIRCTR